MSKVGGRLAWQGREGSRNELASRRESQANPSSQRTRCRWSAESVKESQKSVKESQKSEKDCPGKVGQDLGVSSMGQTKGFICPKCLVICPTMAVYDVHLIRVHKILRKDFPKPIERKDRLTAQPPDRQSLPLQPPAEGMRKAVGGSEVGKKYDEFMRKSIPEMTSQTQDVAKGEVKPIIIETMRASCGVCRTFFSTQRQLTEHIQATGHADASTVQRKMHWAYSPEVDPVRVSRKPSAAEKKNNLTQTSGNNNNSCIII